MREWLSCQRVIHDNPRLREITVTHSLRGDIVLNGMRLRKAESFESAEEESLVLAVVETRKQQRASCTRAEVVPNFLGLGLLAIGGGIKCAILLIPEQVSVEFVRAILGNRGNITH